MVAADVDADGAIELIACDVRGTMAVFKSTGVEAWEKHLKSRIAVAASVGDVDGDGLLDIVVGTTSGAVHAFRARDGAGRERWPIDVGDKILAPLVLTKLRPKKTGLDVLVATHEERGARRARTTGVRVRRQSRREDLRRAAGHVLRRSRRVGRRCLDDGGSRARVQGARLALSPDGFFAARPRLAVTIPSASCSTSATTASCAARAWTSRTRSSIDVRSITPRRR